jgi:hypothetical protein
MSFETSASEDFSITRLRAINSGNPRYLALLLSTGIAREWGQPRVQCRRDRQQLYSGFRAPGRFDIEHILDSLTIGLGDEFMLLVGADWCHQFDDCMLVAESIDSGAGGLFLSAQATRRCRLR